MSINQSNLSNTGFDYVIAVTQDSINGTLEQYLYTGLPEVILCYIYDTNNNLIPIDYATLVSQANNTDPFSIPDGTASSDQRVQNLNNAGFAFAIKAKLGLPPGVPPSKLPPIVLLKAGQSNIIYTLMFSEFIATEISYGARGEMSWVNQSQPFGTSWNFSGPVDLDFQETDFTNLPVDVQNRLKGLGSQNTFSVQQLYYDLNNSNLEQGFQLNDIPPNSALSNFLTGDFINTYWKSLGGSEVLGYGAKQTSPAPASSLAVTDLNFFTPDAQGTEGAPLTLNYLCAANNNPLPDTTHAGFGWNWIEPGEELQYDGAAALNRNTFARYLSNATLPDGSTLSSYAATNCYAPWVQVTYELAAAAAAVATTAAPESLEATATSNTAKVGDVRYRWNMTPGQPVTPNYPPSGSTILSYSYQSSTAEDQAGLDGDLGRMKLSSTYDMSVSVEGNQLTIVQHLVIWTYAKYLATSDSGNIVDKQITDTYSIGVDDQGQLKAALQSSVPVNNSKKPEANGFLEFWAHVDSISDSITQWAQSCVGTNLTDVPVAFVQNFIFPGGRTFSFADASFSDNQDLVSHITYADAS